MSTKGRLIYIMASQTSENAKMRLKLPVLQVVGTREGEARVVSEEFMCGNDMEMSSSTTLVEGKLRSGLAQYFYPVKGSESVGSDAGDPLKWQYVYSDDQLDSLLDEPNWDNVLYLSRIQCKNCAKLDTLLRSIFGGMGLRNGVRLLRVDVDMSPRYLNELQVRLQGYSYSSASTREDCTTCHNTGFVACRECGATGMLTRGSSAVICFRCTGYRKERCPVCGGKCLMC